MDTTSLANLDMPELFHLALHDIQQGKHDGAISKLKQAIEIDADNVQAQFMLAAEYAEIGLFDRAIDGMKRTLELAPDMHIARFQLGLLHYSKGEYDVSRQTWEPLDVLQDNPLALFKSALLLISAGQQRDALPHLERALDVNTDNAALTQDIRKVLQHVRSQLEAPDDAVASPASVLARRYDDVSGDR